MGVVKRSKKYTAGMTEPRTTCFFFMLLFIILFCYLHHVIATPLPTFVKSFIINFWQSSKYVYFKIYKFGVR